MGLFYKAWWQLASTRRVVGTLILLTATLTLWRSVAAESSGTANIFEANDLQLPATEIDRLVLSCGTNVQTVLCSDAVFVRRAYLDVIGTLPTAREARDFIEDADTAGKRASLVEQLLGREEFADYWSMKWGDILRIKAEFPVNLWPNAAQAYHHWVRSSLAANKPYDRFVRELLTSSGSNFRVGPVNFYRAIQNRTPEGISRAVALTFMGCRAERWPTNRLSGMSVFFSQIGYKPTSEWKEECVFWDPLGSVAIPANKAPGKPSIEAIEQNTPGSPSMASNRPVLEAVFPDDTKVTLSPDRDPREVFADWLLRPDNPWFTRSIANRVWAWLMGKGLIEEPDDIRPDNPPSNPALLAYLQSELVKNHYDLKHLYRLILNSRTYQLSCLREFQSNAVPHNFAGYVPRRLEAEVLSDAINKVTGGSELYTSPIPEPFTYIPKGMPAIAVGDGSISSPFLALFGRAPRATGLSNERNNEPTSAQWLYLLNSSDIQLKLEQGPNLQALFTSRRMPSQIADELYLTVLSRYPTAEERKAVEAYSAPQPPPRTNQLAKAAATTNAAPAWPATVAQTNLVTARTNRIGPLGSLGPSRKNIPTRRREDWTDVAWSLINSDEFLYRH